MVQVNWTLQAKDDLESIAIFISKDSEKYARLQIFRLRQRTKILNSQIYFGKIVPEMEVENISGTYRRKL
ncbi:hypothetical protein [Autumnicola edwardsiae]|uniref:Type II toxin-antitoxin system RelE/ParE family toxin n=1 Tax=Autumnicola edwardsiae TaxID=3075594 RepID=A0ABU3CZZ5_9FLAO|nr:hypothetical protein [Zunongwangia sp. F297]MDT0651475.1 hypothetical protein [Zunongwangia sp. F297]